MGAIGRTVAGIIVEIVSWVAMATIAFIALRIAWPAYAAAEPAMHFDVPMMIARLMISSVALILAAWLTAATVRNAPTAPLAGGIVLLVAFIPIHIGLWSKFPIWYHLAFLASLPLLTFLGGRSAGLKAA